MATSQPRQTAQTRVLRKLYPHVLSVRAYLERTFLVKPRPMGAGPVSDKWGACPFAEPLCLGNHLGVDPPEYRRILDDIYVAVHQLPPPQRIGMEELTTDRSQTDVVLHCIGVLLQAQASTSLLPARSGANGIPPRPPPPIYQTTTVSTRRFNRSATQKKSVAAKHRPRAPINVLTAGHRESGDYSVASLRNLPAVEAYFPNTLVNFVKTRPWQQLLSRIGEQAMIHLLTKTSLFLYLEHGSWCQVTGVPPSTTMIFAPLPKTPPPDRMVAGGPHNHTRKRTDQPVLVGPFPSTGTKRKRTDGNLSIRPARLRRAHSDPPEQSKVPALLTTSTSPSVSVTHAQPSREVLGRLVPVDTLVFSRWAILHHQPGRRPKGTSYLRLDPNHLLNQVGTNPTGPCIGRAIRTIFGSRFTTPAPAVPPPVHPRSEPTGREDGTLTRITSPVVRGGRAPLPATMSGETTAGGAWTPHVNATCDPNKPPPTLSRMARRRRRGREAAKLIATSKPAEFQSKAAFIPRVPTGTVVASLQGPGPADTRRKSHWRLRRLRPLVRRLFAKYQRCNIYAMLARWCSLSSAQPKCSVCPARMPDLPVSIQRISNTADPTSTTPRLIERSPNPTASGVGPNPKIRSDADEGVAGISSKPPTPPPIDFLSHRCNHHRVTFFLHTVLNSIVPQPLWGSPANRRAICRFINRFISAPLGDVFTMSDLLSGLRVEDFHWALFSPRSTCLPRTHRVSALRKAQELVVSFLWWLIEGLVIPLVQGFFYVTESAETRLHLLYYRHDTWRRLTHPALRATLDHMYRTVPTNQLVATFARRKLGCASLRLMPKRNGLRLITNYSARNVRLVALLGAGSTDITSVISERSINFDLREVFRVLLYERERRPEVFASSVFGMSEVYTRLLAYKRRFGLPLNELVSSDAPGFFYLVKTDVHRAFDHIPQARLLELLDDLLSDDEYLVRTYRRIGDTARGPRARYLQVGSDGDTFLPFPVFAATRARRTQGSAIYVDDVVHGYHLRDDLLGLVREHISDNLIRVGDRRFYRQVVGIPQGSVVSSFLCNLFLSALETRHLAEFHSAPALLLRLTDDFLLITPDRAQAQRFYHRVCAQFPDFGCQFNPHKTLANFDVGLGVDLGPTHRADIDDGRRYEGFPWCGLRIDPVTLDVHTDYTRYHDHRLRDTVTLPCQLNSAQALAGKLRLLIYGRLDDLRLSLDLLTPRSVLINVYENFVLNALRFCALLRKLPRPVPTASWLADLVGQCVDETARFISRYHRRQFQARGQAGNPTRLSPTHHQWLGYHAFSRTLAGRQPQHRVTIRLLRSQLTALPIKPKQRGELYAIVSACDHKALSAIKL